MFESSSSCSVAISVFSCVVSGTSTGSERAVSAILRVLRGEVC